MISQIDMQMNALQYFYQSRNDKDQFDHQLILEPVVTQ